MLEFCWVAENSKTIRDNVSQKPIYPTLLLPLLSWLGSLHFLAQLLGSGGHQTSRHPSDLIGETLEECRENQSAINHLLLAKVAKDDTWAAWNVWLRSFWHPAWLGKGVKFDDSRATSALWKCLGYLNPGSGAYFGNPKMPPLWHMWCSDTIGMLTASGQIVKLFSFLNLGENNHHKGRLKKKV